jgi:hypothetical protein
VAKTVAMADEQRFVAIDDDSILQRQQQHKNVKTMAVQTTTIINKLWILW